MIQTLNDTQLAEERARFAFSSNQARSDELLKLEAVEKSIGGRVLFSNLTVTLTPGTRLGVIGPNGCGKSTLLKTISGALKPDRGRVARAPNLRVVMFDQLRTSLNRDLTLRTTLCTEGDQVYFNGKAVHVASWARRFLFQTDQLSVPLRYLSGGEQARALFARCMVEPADVLILDEPTNDLDIPTLEVLEESLSEFMGAVVLVTHDRFLLDRVATQVFGFGDFEHGGLFASYAQWERARDELAEHENQTQSTSRKNPTTEPTSRTTVASMRTGLTFTERHELEKLEKSIPKLERKLQQQSEALTDPAHASNGQKLQELLLAETAAREELEAAYARWEQLEEKKAQAGADASGTP